MIYICYDGTNEQEKALNAALLKHPNSHILSGAEQLSAVLSRLNEGDTIIVVDILNLDLSGKADNNRDLNLIASSVSETYQAIFSTGAKLIIWEIPSLGSEVFRSAIINNHMRDSSAVEMAVSEILESQIRLIVDEKLEKKKKKRSTKISSNSERRGNPKGSKYIVKKELHCKEFLLDNHIDFGGSLTNEEAIGILKISRATFFKYKRELLSSSSATSTPPKPVQTTDTDNDNKTGSDTNLPNVSNNKKLKKVQDKELSNRKKTEKKPSSNRKKKKKDGDQGIEGQLSIFDLD